VTGPNPATRPLRIEPGPSRSWKRFILGLHGLALAGFLLAVLPLWVRLSGVVVVGLSLLWEVRRGSPQSDLYGIRALVARDGGHWRLETDNGFLKARLLSSSRLWSKVAFLRFETGGRRLWLVLPADALSGDDFRHLSTRLRLSEFPD